MNLEREIYFDFLRGIAIMMVVGIHTFNPATYDFNSFSGQIADFIRQTLNCAVPLFLAISGYFLATKDVTNKRSHKSFLARQISKIYIPTLVFSLPYFIPSVIFAGSIKSIAINTVTLLLCGYSIYYFILLIIQYYLLLPVLDKLNDKKGLVIASIISTINILVVTYLLKIQHLDLPLFIYAGPFTLWIIFFVLGMYLRKHNRDYSLWLPLCLIVIGLVGSLIESGLWMNLGEYSFGIKLPSFIYSAGIILLLFSNKIKQLFDRNITTRIFVSIGNISFGMYLLHIHLISLFNQSKYIYIYIYMHIN